MTPEQYRAIGKAKRSKYGNKPVVVDGIRFDSTREAAYYGELKLREKAGEVGGVELQRPFPLLAPNGELVAVYKSDFAFFDFAADRFRVIDVKGFDTPLSKHKRRHVRAQYGFEVEIVR